MPDRRPDSAHEKVEGEEPQAADEPEHGRKARGPMQRLINSPKPKQEQEREEQKPAKQTKHPAPVGGPSRDGNQGACWLAAVRPASPGNGVDLAEVNQPARGTGFSRKTCRNHVKSVMKAGQERAGARWKVRQFRRPRNRPFSPLW